VPQCAGPSPGGVHSPAGRCGPRAHPAPVGRGLHRRPPPGGVRRSVINEVRAAGDSRSRSGCALQPSAGQWSGYRRPPAIGRTAFPRPGPQRLDGPRRPRRQRFVAVLRAAGPKERSAPAGSRFPPALGLPGSARCRQCAISGSGAPRHRHRHRHRHESTRTGRTRGVDIRCARAAPAACGGPGTELVREVEGLLPPDRTAAARAGASGPHPAVPHRGQNPAPAGSPGLPPPVDPRHAPDRQPCARPPSAPLNRWERGAATASGECRCRPAAAGCAPGARPRRSAPGGSIRGRSAS
jgi:hypothetical protein